MTGMLFCATQIIKSGIETAQTKLSLPAFVKITKHILLYNNAVIPPSVMLAGQLQMSVQPIADGGFFDFTTFCRRTCFCNKQQKQVSFFYIRESNSLPFFTWLLNFVTTKIQKFRRKSDVLRFERKRKTDTEP